MITAALYDVPANIGYPLLFALVAAESAGALVPGETALLVAGALAARGRLELPLVIAVAATAAIVGDNVGYTLGRRGLRPLLDRPGRRSGRRQQLIARGETFFLRYGGPTVFVGRWLPGLRVFASWLAGAERMQWRRFLFWNALGGICWAATIGAAGYLIGQSLSGSLGAVGFVVLALLAVGYLAFRMRARRVLDESGGGKGDAVGASRRSRSRSSGLCSAGMTVVSAIEHGDFHYDVVVHHRTGQERVHRFVSDEPLEVGNVVRLEGSYWLIESVEPAGADLSGRVRAKPARYRLKLRHPDGREELGAFRRFRADAPRVGHSFSTVEDDRPASWEVVQDRPAFDERGDIYLELTAERDFEQVEDVPDHELEHALARRQEEELPEGAAATLQRAEQLHLSVELVALEPGEEPDWEEAARSIDALILEEIEDDLLEHCGVDPAHDPQETWLDTVKERLRSDLEQFRADVDGDHDEIEQWSFQGGWIYVSVGDADDESDPDKGHGWMGRLVDSGTLRAAGFERVRKADIE